MNGADILIGVRTKPNFCRKGLAPIDDAERYTGDDHIIHITVIPTSH
jgi:hypothetical protein